MTIKPNNRSCFFHRWFADLSIKVLLAGAFSMIAAHAQQPSASPAALDNTALEEILGSKVTDWKIIPPPGVLEKKDGVTVLSSGKQNLNLFGARQYSGDVEYQMVVRLNPPAGGSNASIVFQIGTKDSSVENFKATGVALGGAPNGTGVYCWIGGVATKPGWRNQLYYNFRAVTTPSLAWPEALRKSVEADMARLPDVNHRWITLRYVVRKNVAQLYVDDRLVDIQSESSLDLAGYIRIVLSPNVEIASLRVKPLQPEDPLYRPIAIGGLLNASLLNGKVADRAVLPKEETLTTVGGVPFLFPKVDVSGNDHISIAPSWAQFGALETYIDSNSGEFGGRWTTALTLNPARIQLRVPNEHYNRLYLIAAASDEPNSVPIITAQFYKGLSGYPENFSTRVPLFSAQASDVVKLPIKMKDGTGGSLYLVTIDLDPGKLSKLGNIPAPDTEKHSTIWDGNLDILDVELTKQVQPYQCYPDPNCHSIHQAGLPSSVHVYAMTLERTPLRMDFNSDKFGSVWTAPAVPAYTVKLGNRTTAPRNVELTLTTTSHDGSEKTEQKQAMTIPAGDTDTLAKFTIPNLKLNGYHDIVLTMKDTAPDGQVWTEKRSFARLPVDTRERGNWEPGRGPMMGYYAWTGAHETPNQLEELRVMAEAGAETRTSTFATVSTPPEALAFAKDHQFRNIFLFDQACIYDFVFFAGKVKEAWDSGDRDAARSALLTRLKELEVKGPIPAGNLVPFFPEPGVGMSTYMNMPEFYGEPEYKLTAEEEVKFKLYMEKFLLGAKLVRKEWPNAKILLPHGDPLFCIPFLRYSEEVRNLIDGVALDLPGFERLPEMQLHQVTQQRIYEMLAEFKKYGKKPVLAVIEGPTVPTFADALTWDEQANLNTRNMLSLFVYGAYQQASITFPFDCADYWGEQQYGAGGLFSRMPYASPKPSYVSYATMTRHLNRANYDKQLLTGSNSSYALQFKHYKTGKQIDVIWTIRGKRTVTLTAPKSADVKVYDQDDNLKPLEVGNGTVSFTIDQSPCYVEGLTADPTIKLGASDHGDSKPASDAVKLTNLGDGTWKISNERDMIYENNNPLQVVRFPGKMSTASAEAPAEQGSKALSVHLEKQDKERQLMPWYTTLVPAKPIVIPGQASHLGLWVHAMSDWGRVVYCLTDAKGQRWLSVGTKESYNCDDTRQLSSFCFDGWRYLRFELPSNAPYDNFRQHGSTWWGHHGPGDGIVHLPLTLDKIIVERRTHTLNFDKILPAKPDDVLLGDLNAEYATPFDKTDEVVALSKIQMPVPTNTAALSNPIKDLEAKGVGAPVEITHIDSPTHEYDGTRGLVFFDKSPNALTYDVWVSPYADGNGAVKLATGWKEPGQLMTGLRPDIEFYAFVDYIDKDGKPSKPSKPFKFTLKDMFPMK